jgi:hypothetical protein
MRKFKTTILMLTAFLPLTLISTNSHAAMDPTLERALVKICKAAASDVPVKMKNAISGYNLTESNVALNVMCNNQDIISYAGKHNATKTTARLQRSLGQVSITDVAALSKLNVTFKE